MNVLLIYPEDRAIKEFMSERPPLGLAYIAAVLEKAKHQVKIIDMNLEELTEDDILKHDVIGISFLTPFYSSVKKVVSRIKSLDKNKIIIVGGSHPTVMPAEVLKNNDIDVVIVGEGEETIIKIIDAIEKKKDFKKILGISYKNNNKIIHNPIRPLIKDLDKLPLPARHLLKMDRYVNLIDNEKATTLISSRGCPFNCVYCAQIWRRTWRPRSPENIIKEMEQVIKEYGIRNFYFYDDLVTLDKKRVIDICKLIINKGLKIKWICTARVDTVDREMLGWMKKSGCISVHYGVETGDPEILKKIKKNITLDQAKNAFKWTKEVGIHSKAYFMMGFPWETRKHIMNTINFSLKLDTDERQYLILIPLPGTEIWDYAVEKGIIDENNIDWEEYRIVTLDFKEKVFFTEKLSEKEVIGLRKLAYRKAIIHMLLQKVKEGDVKYLYRLVKEKWNLGLVRFAKGLFFSK